MVEAPDRTAPAQGREISVRSDPNSFSVKSKEGGTLVSWQEGGDKPILFWLGPAGSKDVRIQGANSDTRELVRKLVGAYVNAPNNFGTTDAADKYQDIIKRVAETLGVSEGSLLIAYQ
jgi:hypothetical protein